jgi:sporulation protein YlmC with PRC-barrel domain
VFDRDEVRIRSIAGGEVLQISGMETGRTRQIDLDGEVVKKSPGATEVLAAISE